VSHVRLGRDIAREDGQQPVQFLGEWSPDEPEMWEEFRVMLHGLEAGDQVSATEDDLILILESRGFVVKKR
jgi:hypothetical protein